MSLNFDNISEFDNSLILIVDDDATNLGVITEQLEAHGFEIIIARSGETGLQRAKIGQPNLILLDVLMPGIDGFETCRRLKEDPETQHIPVIFMTILTNVEDKVKGFQVGGVDYITKPFQQEEVIARVSTHLRLRNLMEHLEQKVQERTAELHRAFQKLERLDRVKSDFIQVMSHELRTPLSIIEGYTGLLEDTPAVVDDDELSELTERLKRGSQWMRETVEHVLDASQFDKDNFELHKEMVELTTLIQEVCHVFEPAILKRKISLKQSLEALPLIQGDNVLLHKAFYHVIVNAIKYTPDGGEIHIMGRSLPNWIEIVVSDTGIGISTEHQELVFEKFYRIGSISLHSSGKTNYKGGGPGLGLTIAKSIIMAHQGQIWIESQGHDEEKFPGSRLFIRLPHNNSPDDD